jgi:hypothetical protein
MSWGYRRPARQERRTLGLFHLAIFYRRARGIVNRIADSVAVTLALFMNADPI